MTKSELLALAEELSVEANSKMTKAEIINAILKSQNKVEKLPTPTFTTTWQVPNQLLQLNITNKPDNIRVEYQVKDSSGTVKEGDISAVLDPPNSVDAKSIRIRFARGDYNGGYTALSDWTEWKDIT